MKKMSDFITGPDSWCQRNNFQNADGISTAPDPDYACKFCLHGAFYMSDLTEEDWHRIEEIVHRLHPGKYDNAIQFNDHPDTTYEMVKEVIDYYENK